MLFVPNLGSKFPRVNLLMLLRRGLSWLTAKLATTARNVLLKVLASGPIPQHIAFVMDGNRRYARMNGKAVHQGHADGYITLRRVSSIVKPVARH